MSENQPTTISFERGRSIMLTHNEFADHQEVLAQWSEKHPDDEGELWQGTADTLHGACIAAINAMLTSRSNSAGSMAGRTDTDRLRYLAGCGSDSGPICDGFANVLDDYDTFLGDVLAERCGDVVPDDIEDTDDDRIQAFRRLVDAAIDSRRH